MITLAWWQLGLFVLLARLIGDGLIWFAWVMRGRPGAQHHVVLRIEGKDASAETIQRMLLKLKRDRGGKGLGLS